MRIVLLALVAVALHATAFETLSSHFKQTVTSPEDTTLTYTGNVSANAQEQALWIYESPVEKKIYFNKTQVLILEPELEQVITASLRQTHNLMNFLNETGESETRQVLHEGVEYTVFFKESLPSKIAYKDSLENRVTIEFFQTQLNPTLPMDLFIPHVPQHFDIIHQ